MERNFALSSIITGTMVIMGILFYRLFTGLYRGWDIFMILDPLFFYTLLIMAGVSFLKNRDKAIYLYRFFSWGIVVERSLFMILIGDLVDITLIDYVPLICALPFVIMYPRK
mgnify:CR=1 FL=1